MQLGSYDIPEIRLKPEIIDINKTIYDHIKNNEVPREDLAKLMGYASSISGGFYPKVRSLILYGLLEGRGKFKVTDLGKNIAYPPPNEKERTILYKTVLLNVPLWNEIYQKYGKNTPESFWYTLKEITGEEPVEIHKVANKVKDWYIEDMLLLPDEILKQQEIQTEEPNKFSLEDYKNNNEDNMMTNEYQLEKEPVRNIKFENMSVSLPEKNFLEAWDLLQEYMSVYIKRHFKNKPIPINTVQERIKEIPDKPQEPSSPES